MTLTPMPECQQCGQPFEPTKWWRTFCSTECRQVFHRRKYKAEKVEHFEHRLNGGDRGTKAEREAAKAAITAFTEGLRRPEVSEPAQPLRRRF
jgi:predicted nucleic acid-binding Zn ribbon protein